MKRLLLAAMVGGAIAVMAAPPSYAQLEDNLGALTEQNAKGYLQPLANALPTTLNMGAFQTGNVAKVGFNFSIGFSAMAVAFEDEDRLYRPTDPPGFTSTGPIDAPTVVGDEDAVDQPGQGGTTLYHPGGFNLDQFTIAVPQVTLGSILGTRAVVRWFSGNVGGDSEVGEIDLLGIGVQHSLSQYFPGLPVDLAIGGMYQSMHVGDDKLIDTDAIHAEITASKSFSFIQPYVAVGYNRSTVESNYEQDTGSGTQKIHVEFDEETSANFTGGVAIGIPLFKAFVQVSTAEQTGAAAGLTFGFGN